MSRSTLRLLECCSGLGIGTLSLLVLIIGGVGAFWAILLSLAAWAMGWLLIHGFMMTSKKACRRALETAFIAEASTGHPEVSSRD